VTLEGFWQRVLEEGPTPREERLFEAAHLGRTMLMPPASAVLGRRP